MPYGTITFIDKQNRRLSVDATFTLTRYHTVVVTPLVGRSGSVKEYIQAEDYQIEMTITVGSQDPTQPAYRQYPHEQIRSLLHFWEEGAHQSFRVQNDYLQLFGIEEVVIQSKQITQSTHSNQQQITLTCLSDTPYEIESVA